MIRDKNETIGLVVLSVVLFLLFLMLIVGCKSVPLLDSERPCKHVNIAGQPWQEPSSGLITTFNDDCSGMIQECQKYFTYKVIDDNNIKVYIDGPGISAVREGLKHGCPSSMDGPFTCNYTLTRLLDIKEEVLDIKCNWNDEMKQLTRAGN